MYIPPTGIPANSAAASEAQLVGKVENIKVLHDKLTKLAMFPLKTLQNILETLTVFPSKELHDILATLAVFPFRVLHNRLVILPEIQITWLATRAVEFIKTFEVGVPMTTLVEFIATFMVGLPASPIDKADSDE